MKTENLLPTSLPSGYEKTLKTAAFLLLFFVCGFQPKAQDTLVFQKKYLPKNDTVKIVTPADYAPADAYPAVFLLHGWSQNYRVWDKVFDAQQIADCYNFILIFPDGLYDSWYMNSPVNPKQQYARFFFDDLLPAMHQNYSIDSSLIFLSGYSMGGHGALWLFFEHPELFRSAASSSGVMDLNASSLKESSLPKLLGDYETNRKRFDQYSVINRLHKIQQTDKIFWFDCGTNDHLYQANRRFREKCDKLGIKAISVVQPGKHHRSYWKKAFLMHFEFFYSLTHEDYSPCK